MEYEGGLKNYDLSCDFNQDFAAGALDATLWPLLGVKTAFEIRAVSSVRAVTNPSWVGMGILNAYPPLGNSVGELSTGTFTMQGSGELQRLTS